MLKGVDGVPECINIMRSAVVSAELKIGKSFAEFGGGIFGEKDMVGILSDLYQSMTSTQANWEIKSQSDWFISSLCMSVACAALYHFVDDSVRSQFFLPQEHRASLSDLGKERFLLKPAIINLYDDVEPFQYSEPAAEVPQNSAIDVVQDSASLKYGSAPNSNLLTPPSLNPMASLTVSETDPGSVASAVWPSTSIVPGLNVAQVATPIVWPETVRIGELMVEFYGSTAPKVKAKLTPIAITIYLHSLGLQINDWVFDLRCKLGAIQGPLRGIVVKRSELYGVLANAGRLRSLNRSAAECRDIALLRKNAGETVALNAQQRRDREERWIAWHAFLASQTFDQGPLPLPVWQ